MNFKKKFCLNTIFVPNSNPLIDKILNKEFQKLKASFKKVFFKYFYIFESYKSKKGLENLVLNLQINIF